MDRLGTLICACVIVASSAAAQAPVKLTIDTTSREFAIPNDFVGLGFETRSVAPNTYGVSGYFFTPTNTQLITLFQNIGIKNIRVGGGTVDGSGRNEHCVMPTPTHKDIDNLFEFAQAAGIKVIYSFRLLNLSACADPNLAAEDAASAQYIWSKYRANLDSFSIGNEPDVLSFHTRPGQMVDPAIYETTPHVPGSAYPSYLADWRHFADVILKSVPEAKFSGPDTAVSSTSSFTPNPANGVSWTQKFAEDLKDSGFLAEALQHHYVWGNPGSTTAREAIDDMLSSAWDNDTSIGTQPANNGGTAEFHPYPFVYARVLAPLVSYGVPYRMTEANDCLHGVVGASDGYAAALWALDYMHWWAAHHMAGVNFHNNPWIPTDTVVPDPNPCPASGCGNYRISPKAYGLKAFDLGGHGYVEPIAISNPEKINLTAYAVGTSQDLFVTIINKTHATTNDTAGAAVTIQANGFKSGSAAYMVLTGGEPGNATAMTATLGGASITNHARWRGKWNSLGRVTDGKIELTVQSTTATIVKIHRSGAYAGPIQMNQNGALEIFDVGPSGHIRHRWQEVDDDSESRRWSDWAELSGGTYTRGNLAVVKNEDNRLEIFAEDVKGSVVHNMQMTPGGDWSGWSELASGLFSGLKAATNADGSVSVFGIGTNGDVWIDSQSAPGVGWSGWRDMSGTPIQAGFVVGENPDGKLEVFGVDRNGSVWHDRQTESGTWGGWSKLGGRMLPQLGIARNLDGRLELFGVGTDGHLYGNPQMTPEGNWGGWSELGEESIESGFAVGQHQDGRIVIFGVKTLPDGTRNELSDSGAKREARQVWNISQQTAGGAYGKWKIVGDTALDQLMVGNEADGDIRLFGVAKDKTVWSARESTSGGGWTNWSGLQGKDLDSHPHSSPLQSFNRLGDHP